MGGATERMPPVFQGAIPWSTYVLLRLMQREWERPATEPHSFSEIPGDKRPAERLLIVILFWTLFEDIMNRFFAAGLADLPDGVRSDLLARYNTIGSCLERLYRIVWSTTFWDDLRCVGDGALVGHLRAVQERRNAFVHGVPEAIDEGLVRATVEQLHAVQAAWIEIYNLRCTRRVRRIPVWRDPA